LLRRSHLYFASAPPGFFAEAKPRQRVKGAKPPKPPDPGRGFFASPHFVEAEPRQNAVSSPHCQGKANKKDTKIEKKIKKMERKKKKFFLSIEKRKSYISIILPYEVAL
jgi:hypothetical protein